MKPILAIVAVVLAAAALLASALTGYAVQVNNELVALDTGVDEKWAQVQNVYQRRADLVPNLVETVKGYAAHERETLAAVVRARASATAIQATPELMRDPEALTRFQVAQTALSGALSRLLVTLERYPKLKADRGFLALQAQLEGTENRIAVERQRFNLAARDYNTRVRLFPGRLVAARLGYSPRPFFAADVAAQVAPRVDFGSR